MDWINLVVIHLVEIAVVGIFLLIRRNNVLEKAVQEQQQYINAISIIIDESQNKLSELDTLGAFKNDDEVGGFFTALKEIQEILNTFNNRR